MFERYTEQARRVIFYARHEAVKAGHKEIETIDLLRGLGHEWPQLKKALDLSIRLYAAEKPHREKEDVPESWWPRVSGKIRSSSGEMIPFSEASKNALRYAVESAEHAESKVITIRHLLVGVSREDALISKLLAEEGVSPEDFPWPEKSESHPGPVRHQSVGIGYDYHRLVEGRKLILGGVEVPFGKGLTGHSDGDVLTHAICDALLGAAGLGDLGQHFPDTDPQWKDVSSLELLAQVLVFLKGKNLRVVQVDSVVMAERPKLAPHFDPMREMLAGALGLEPGQVNVKAKTTEGLGAVGRGEAMAAQAVALLESA